MPARASWRVDSFVRSRYSPMFGADRFASTRRTFLPKSLTRDEAVSNANVVFPTPPYMDTNARMLLILSPYSSNELVYIKFMDWLVL